MFNKNKKRIEELERQIKELNSIKIEKDAITKNLHFKEDMVCVKGEGIGKSFTYYGFEIFETAPKDFYFLKGTEPNVIL